MQRPLQYPEKVEAWNLQHKHSLLHHLEIQPILLHHNSQTHRPHPQLPPHRKPESPSGFQKFWLSQWIQVEAPWFHFLFHRGDWPHCSFLKIRHWWLGCYRGLVARWQKCRQVFVVSRIALQYLFAAPESEDSLAFQSVPVPETSHPAQLRTLDVFWLDYHLKRKILKTTFFFSTSDLAYLFLCFAGNIFPGIFCTNPI